MRWQWSRAVVALMVATAGCAPSYVYRPLEAKTDVFDGQGGTRVIVAGMDIWDTGEPPRKFRVLGLIDDQRQDGIPMALLQRDMVKKAREVGGDALILLGSQSRISGYSTSGQYAGSDSMRAYTTANRVNMSRFAVIKYLD